ncbi:MAG: dTMP kinase [Parvularculaceae bacterium]
MTQHSHTTGFFISFEGGDGSGKTTQIRRLADYLQKHGHKVVLTREPGGSPGAEAIRDILVKGAADRWTAISEALLMYAARADHLARVIKPALKRGEIVITDRFADSSMAYQGIAGALGESSIATLHDLVVGDDDPDLTIILDLPVASGLGRADKRAADENRFECKGQDFHESVRQAFLKIAHENPDRCVVIDASPAPETVSKAVADAVEKALQSRL